MGLCKCRNITNFFCFNHRRNVCEECVLTDHPKCIVRPYLQWLQSSDFSAECSICKQGLAAGPTLRLQCMDIFHVSCIRGLLEANSSTSGCPQCNKRIIPHSSQTGPLAEQVRKVLSFAQPVVPAPSEPSLTSDGRLPTERNVTIKRSLPLQQGSQVNGLSRPRRDHNHAAARGLSTARPTRICGPLTRRFSLRRIAIFLLIIFALSTGLIFYKANHLLIGPN